MKKQFYEISITHADNPDDNLQEIIDHEGLRQRFPWLPCSPGILETGLFSMSFIIDTSKIEVKPIF